MACRTYDKCEPCVAHGCIYGVLIDDSKACVNNTGEFTGDRIFQFIDGCDDLEYQIPSSFKVLAISGWILAALFCLALVTCFILFNFGIRRLDNWIATVLNNERESFANSNSADEPNVRQRRKSFDRSVSQQPTQGTSTAIPQALISPPSPSKQKNAATYELFARPRFNFIRASSCPASIDVPAPLHTTVRYSAVIREEDEEETEFSRTVQTVAIITTEEANGEELEYCASDNKKPRKPWTRKPNPECSPAVTRLQALHGTRRLHQV